MHGKSETEGVAIPASRMKAPGLLASLAWILGMVALQFVGILVVALTRDIATGRAFNPNGLDAVTMVTGLGVGTGLLLILRAQFLATELLPRGRRTLPEGREMLATAGVLLACGLFTAIYESIAIDNKVMQPENQLFINAMASSPLATVITFVTGAVLVPIAEELIFRGQLQGAIFSRVRTGIRSRPDLHPYIAIAITAAAFSAVHMQPLAALPLFVTGFAFGWLRWKTGSLMLPIAGHMVLNAFGFSMILMTGQA